MFFVKASQNLTSSSSLRASWAGRVQHWSFGSHIKLDIIQTDDLRKRKAFKCAHHAHMLNAPVYPNLANQCLSWSTCWLDCILALWERYRIYGNHLVFLLNNKLTSCSKWYPFGSNFDNLILRLFHIFGCKQPVSNILTTSSAFATHGDAHGAHPVRRQVFVFVRHRAVENAGHPCLSIKPSSTIELLWSWNAKERLHSMIWKSLSPLWYTIHYTFVRYTTSGFVEPSACFMHVTILKEHVESHRQILNSFNLWVSWLSL